MTANEILAELKKMGTENYKKIMLNHGVKEPIFGVKIEEMKEKFVKRIKMDYQLAKDLYDTGVYDAMYLAGLIADDAKMTKKDLKHWINNAHSCGISEYTVPWVASGSPHGLEMALEWIDSKKEHVAASGWSTLGCLVATKDDSELDMTLLKKLLQRVGKTIHDQPNRVRYFMNGFVIAVGGYIGELSDLAMKTAASIGKVTVDMGDTACRVPDAVEYIKKMHKRGCVGKKRKSAKC